MSDRLNLVVFLNHLQTLRSWDAVAILERQLATYRFLQDRGIRISLFSHGGRDEYEYSTRIPGMKILCNWTGLTHKTYERRAHLIHVRDLLNADLLITSNATGMITALRSSRCWRIPLIYRTGYHWSTASHFLQSDDATYVRNVEGLERQALNHSTHIVTTTREIAEKMVRQVPAAAEKLTVIPNHVDTSIFRPIQSEKQYDLVFVGRISSVKNLGSLLEAVEQLGLTIAVVGTGSPIDGGKRLEVDEENKLLDRFGDLNGRIHWLGRINNDDLPVYINQARVFVLCSLMEGHPRALAEAMACGMPIIGTNVTGIDRMIEHEITGFLCQTDADSIAAAISAVFAQPELMIKMGENARAFAVRHYSLPQIAERQCELLTEIARRNPVDSKSKRAAQYVLRRR